jgi:hypothetical protein
MHPNKRTERKILVVLLHAKPDIACRNLFAICDFVESELTSRGGENLMDHTKEKQLCQKFAL